MNLFSLYFLGYVYQVLIEFSYDSLENSQHLVEYLNKRLQRPSPHGVTKTLKTINHLVTKGSRHFRNGLRKNDEHIKNAGNYADRNSVYTGTEILENIRKLSRDILVELFRDDRIAADASTDPEQSPTSSNPAPSGKLIIRMIIFCFIKINPGMGSYVSSSSTGGKYEGFGNSPITKSSMTDRVRDLLESVINLPDPKQQIMQLCLEVGLK